MVAFFRLPRRMDRGRDLIWRIKRSIAPGAAARRPGRRRGLPVRRRLPAWAAPPVRSGTCRRQGVRKSARGRSGRQRVPGQLEVFGGDGGADIAGLKGEHMVVPSKSMTLHFPPYSHRRSCSRNTRDLESLPSLHSLSQFHHAMNVSPPHVGGFFSARLAD